MHLCLTMHNCTLSNSPIPILFRGVPNEGVEIFEGMRYVDIERTRGVSHYDSLAIYIKRLS